MKIKEVVISLEAVAPLSLQEGYDNAGLITGDENADCTSILVSLDATPAVVDEAVKKGCNLIVSHHPIVFSGLKKITGKNYVQKTIIKAIKIITRVAKVPIPAPVNSILGNPQLP